MVSILFVIPDYEYNFRLNNLIKTTISSTDKVLYVSLNKTYKSLVHQFQKENIDVSKFFFIDGISKHILNPEPVDNCLFILMEEGMKRFEKQIILRMKYEKISFIIFDSLSALTTYEKKNDIINLISELIIEVNNENASIIFVCLKDDKVEPLLTYMKMKVDKVIEV